MSGSIKQTQTVGSRLGTMIWRVKMNKFHVLLRVQNLFFEIRRHFKFKAFVSLHK